MRTSVRRVARQGIRVVRAGVRAAEMGTERLSLRCLCVI